MTVAARWGCGLSLMCASLACSDTVVTRTTHVLVTNDDGYGAAGIDAVVEALSALPGLLISVVAPATNRSGTGGSTSEGIVTAADARTLSGRPAKAVDGYPADCLRWAVDQHGLAERPDVVISGINLGENPGPIVDISGTVGAARAAWARGIPALAASAVLNANTDFRAGASFVRGWLDEHLAAIAEGQGAGLLENLNIPSCPTGQIRGVVRAPLAPTNNGVSVDCTSKLEAPADDVEALNAGFAVFSVLPPHPASSSDTSD